jgi:hypothetical protein
MASLPDKVGPQRHCDVLISLLVYH